MQFLQNLSSYEAAIAYFPIKNELDPKICISAELPPIRFIVPDEQSADPAETAQQVNAFFRNTCVCLYIPGTAFDAYGVRHGRGGGWYDRFLSLVSPQWTRVGFCFEHQFSHTHLTREMWDEPVDWLCVKRDDNTMDFYETKARLIQ